MLDNLLYSPSVRIVGILFLLENLLLETISGEIQPESSEIKFPVPVNPEPQPGLEIPECQNVYPDYGKKNRNCVWANPVYGSGS